jgi:4'-phosphopantetheinyl transferase
MAFELGAAWPYSSADHLSRFTGAKGRMISNAGASYRIELGPDDVHIWRARLDGSPAELRSLGMTLAPDEADRALRFRFVRHRDLFVAARGILRHILSSYVNTPPDALLLRSGASGKPFMTDTERGVHFNVSHSGTQALYAVARREVGIDIEQIDGRFATPDIAERVFTCGELAELHTLPASMRERVFFDCWTRKEAYLKGRAEGLAMPLNKLEVWSKRDESRVLFSRGQAWLLCPLGAATGYSAAVAVEGGCADIKYFTFPLSDGESAIDDVPRGLQRTAHPEART